MPTAGIYLILTPEPRTGKSIVPNLHVKIIVNGSMKRIGARRILIAWPTSKDKVRAWHKARPDYSRKRRASDPALTMGNRIQTRIRMRDQRFRSMFDKSKSILTQLIGKTRDKCCLISGQWLYLRLTKASPLSKPWRVRHTGQRLKRILNRLPKGRLYDLSGLFNGGFL